jgi:hypothetical protein
MKKIKMGLMVAFTAFAWSGHAQTGGTLSLTFTQLPHTSYTGTKNVMAVWIETSGGSFVKTRTRNVGTGTNDHLATFASASGGTSGNALGPGCNVVGATTGATYTSFSTRTITWDGTDVNGNVVADGDYVVKVQSTWNHGGGSTVVRSYPFTKGTNADNQSPASDANFSDITLTWNPSSSALNEVDGQFPDLLVYPNPSNSGQFTVEFNQSTLITVFDLQGNVILEESLEGMNGQKEIDLSEQANGNYIVRVTDGLQSAESAISIAK